jgi:signal transduction histidine kinase
MASTGQPPPAGDTRSDLDDVVGNRAWLLGIGMTAVFVACVVFGALRLVVHLATGKATPWWGNTTGAVAIALLYLWYRRSPEKRSPVAVHGTALVATIALLIPAAYGMASSKWWLSLVGFSVLLMGRRREALVWTIATMILVPLTAVIETKIVIARAVGEPPVERALAGFFFVAILLGITWAFRRVVEQRARELTETATSLERANRVKSRFLAHMSHEIRTPLHGVIAMTEMAVQGDASPTVRDQVQTAHQSAQILLGLLNNILDVTRAESDAIQLDERSFSLHAALTDVVRPFAARAHAKGLELDARSEPAVAARRIGDKARFAQIVLNLVGNAIKFTGGGKVSVHLKQLPGDGARVELEVSDTGVGIPADKLGIIFEPFNQAAAADAQVQSGAGLGLTIVRDLAQRMGGSVSARSEVGKGSTFRVELRLPRDTECGDEAGPEDLLPAALAPEQRAPPLVESGGLDVLVCEDDLTLQKVLRTMVSRLGHRVTIASDGLEGWEILQTRSFDLLLTDLEMPRLSGFGLTQRIRTREKDGGGARLAIIAVTGHVGEEEEHRVLEAGMDALLPKPFSLAVLKDALGRVARPT